MHILEKIHNEQPELKIFMVYFPKEKHHLLPDFIIPINTIEELPDNCIALIDESALHYYAHHWMKKETEVMDKLISVSGQKKQTIIFVTHTMRKFAVTLLLDINTLLVKKPSLLQMKLERSEFRKLIEEIDQEYNKLPQDDVKRSVYVVSDDYKGFITNPLPSFWSEDLSEAYAGVNLEEKAEIEEKTFMPMRIDGGLKLWFSKKNIKKVLHILSKNSVIDGVLSEMGVQCADGKCYYSFDIKKSGDKYTLSNNKFDLEVSIKEFKEKEISVMVDTESCGIEGIELVLKPEIKVKEEKNVVEEYAKNLKI